MLSRQETFVGALLFFMFAVIMFTSAKKDRWYSSDILKRICGGFAILFGLILIGTIFFPMI